jgi:HNH endonuclease
MISDEIREKVRNRAGFACEYCGVTETDTGGVLTIDHFQPKTKGGSDNSDNLVYCCTRCNQYKLDYWQVRNIDMALWNTRHKPFSEHFIVLDSGMLYPLTQTGIFSLQRLRLNRHPLVAYRLRKRHQLEEERLLSHYRDLVQLLEKANTHLLRLTKEQQELLKEQQCLLRLFFNQRK